MQHGSRLDSASTNIYWAGQYSQIPYRVYVCSGPLSASNSQTLQRALWTARRQCFENVPLTIYNNELWIFSLKEEEAATLPIASAFGLREISSGLFIPMLFGTHSDSTMGGGSSANKGSSTSVMGAMGSTGVSLGTSDPSSLSAGLGQPQPAPAAGNSIRGPSQATTPAPSQPLEQAVVPHQSAPLMRAIQEMLIYNVIKARGSGFLPFSSNQCIRPPVGQLLTIETSLSTKGDLFVKMFYSQTRWKLVSPERHTRDSPVLLLPFARKAIFLELADSPPADSSVLTDTIHLVTGKAAQTYSTWCKVRVGDIEEFLWPTDLLLNASKDKKSPINWSETKDLFTALEANMKSLEKASSKNAETKLSDVPMSPPRQHQHPPTAPQTSHGLASTSQPRSLAESSLVYPTPPDPLTREDNLHVGPVKAEGDDNGDWGDLDEELFGGGDEITEADFNFFDQPEEEDHEDSAANFTNDLNHIPEKPSPSEPPETLEGLKPTVDVKIVSDEQTVTPFQVATNDNKPLDLFTGSPKSEQLLTGQQSKRKASAFDPIYFSSKISKGLDQKYYAGGRFYLPPEIDSDSESEEEDGIKQVNTPATEVLGSLSADRNVAAALPPAEAMKGNDQMWLTIISGDINALPESVESPEFDIFHSTSTSHLKYLADELVWDNNLIDIGTNPVAGRWYSDAFVEDLSQLFTAFDRLRLCNVSQGMIKDDQIIDLTKPDQTSSQPAAISGVSSMSTTSTVVDIDDGSKSAKVMSPFPAGSTPVSEVGTPTVIPAVQPVPPSQSKRPTRITNSAFQLPAPSYSFIRQQRNVKALAPILRFWRIFGLEPKEGARNIKAILLHPKSDAMEYSCSFYWEALVTAYNDSQLGTISSLLSASGQGQPIQGYNQSNDGGSHAEGIESALSALEYEVNQAAETGDEPIIILLVHPTNSVRSLAETSITFSRLFHSHQNVFLKIIPDSCVASSDTILTPSQSDILHMALSIYDKAGYKNGYRSSQAFALARMPPAPPSGIAFSYTTQPPESVIDQDSFIHVCYKVSERRDFVAVAWSDQFGKHRRTDLFSLRALPFEDICAKIWNVCLEMGSELKAKFRLAIAKVGDYFEKDELLEWLRHKTTDDNIGMLHILTLDINSSMVVENEGDVFVNNAKAASNMQKVESSTPNATPQRVFDVDSPEHYPTPSNILGAHETKQEGDLVTTDTMDDIWGIIYDCASSPIPSSRPPLSVKPLLVGYLMKPQSNVDKPLRTFEACLVHSSLGNGGQYPHMMRTILFQYRNLASVGLYHGVCSKENSSIPWHAMAVDKLCSSLVTFE